MLNFRPIDFNSDVPSVVDLLKKGLSENHTVSNFLWKHYENPFGKSFGLLACDGEKIIGLKIFMSWEFKRKDRIVKAIRPVDSIIHSDYRRQGIFEKLTVEAFDRNTAVYDFVFNTPNEKSLAANLKMGWNLYKKPLNYYLSLIIPSRGYSKQIIFLPKAGINLQNLEVLDADFFRTNITTPYLEWRFKSKEYSFAWYRETHSLLLLVYRIKTIKGFKTLILVDFVGSENLLKRAIKGLAFKLSIFAVYHLGNKEMFKINKKIGDSVVAYADDKKNIHSEIRFSLADLEGKL